MLQRVFVIAVLSLTLPALARAQTETGYAAPELRALEPPHVAEAIPAPVILPAYLVATPLVRNADGTLSGGEIFYETTNASPFFVYLPGEADPVLSSARIRKDEHGKPAIEWFYRSDQDFTATPRARDPKVVAREVADFLQRLREHGEARCILARQESLYIPRMTMEVTESKVSFGDHGDTIIERGYVTRHELESDEPFVVYPKGTGAGSTPFIAPARIVDDGAGGNKIEYYYSSRDGFDAASGLHAR